MSSGLTASLVALDPNIMAIDSMFYKCSFALTNGVICNDHASSTVENPVSHYRKYRCDKHVGRLDTTSDGPVNRSGLAPPPPVKERSKRLLRKKDDD